MNKEISDKIRNKSRYMITDFDLSRSGYYRIGKNKGITKWILKEYHNKLTSAHQKNHPEKRKRYQKTYYERHREEILKKRKEYRANNYEKVKEGEKQWKHNHSEQCKAQRKRWESEHKEERYEYNKEWRETHPEAIKVSQRKYYQNHRDFHLKKQKDYAKNHHTEIIEYRKEYYKSNKEEINKKVKYYNQTPSGIISKRKRSAKHKRKGFISLNHQLLIDYDWHHIHKDLPFVIAIPREIHQYQLGKKHCDIVNRLADLDIFIDTSSTNTSKEYVETIIEKFFPEQFRRYWIGDYYGRRK